MPRKRTSLADSGLTPSEGRAGEQRIDTIEHRRIGRRRHQLHLVVSARRRRLDRIEQPPLPRHRAGSRERVGQLIAEHREVRPGIRPQSGFGIVAEREPEARHEIRLTAARVRPRVAHRYEVFWVGPLDGDRYPGEAALDALAARTCAQRFTPVVGIEIDAIPDGTQLLRLQPSEESWNDGDRDVECIVAFEADRAGRLGEGDET